MNKQNHDEESSSCVLCDRQNELLCQYVRGLALLFADEPSGAGVLFTDEERRSISSKVNETHARLLETGLSEEAISYRAKELALKSFDF